LIQAKDILSTKEAFENIYKSFHERLFFHATKFVNDHEAARDIVQEVFIKLWLRKDEIEINSSLKSYLFKSVNNTCINYLHSEKKKDLFLNDIMFQIKLAETNYYKDNCIEEDMIKKLMLALYELPEKYKEVILLSRIQGLKNKEISEQLNIPLRTVETLIYRGLKKIKEQLKEEYNLQLLFMHFTQNKLHNNIN